MEGLLRLIAAFLRSVLALFRSRGRQALIELALRQQLAVYSQRHKPRLRQVDRAFWIALRRLWPHWREVLVSVKPDTVVRWHREGFRIYWRWISKRGPGRPRLPAEVRELIRRFALEKPGERGRSTSSSKIGFAVSLATVSRYLPRGFPVRQKPQNWRTFLRNHRDGIAAMDFFTVSTVGFRVLHVWFVLAHGRRQLMHFNVTANPRRRGWSNSSARPFLRRPHPRISCTTATRSSRGLFGRPFAVSAQSPCGPPIEAHGKKGSRKGGSALVAANCWTMWSCSTNGTCIDGFVNTSPTTTLNAFIRGCETRHTGGRSNLDHRLVRGLSGFPVWVVSTTATSGAKQRRHPRPRSMARTSSENTQGARRPVVVRV